MVEGSLLRYCHRLRSEGGVRESVHFQWTHIQELCSNHHTSGSLAFLFCNCLPSQAQSPAQHIAMAWSNYCFWQCKVRVWGEKQVCGHIHISYPSSAALELEDKKKFKVAIHFISFFSLHFPLCVCVKGSLSLSVYPRRSSWVTGSTARPGWVQ